MEALETCQSWLEAMTPHHVTPEFLVVLLHRALTMRTTTKPKQRSNNDGFWR